MVRATLSTCSTHSRSILSCSRRWRVASRRPVLSGSTPRRSCPFYAVDDDSTRFDLHSGRRYAQKLPSIVEAADGEATYHLVPIGRLVLDVGTDVGDAGMLFSSTRVFFDPPTP
jgi:hypothetical protein